MNEKQIPVQKSGAAEPQPESRSNPMHALQRRINDIFDDFWSGFQFPALNWPQMPMAGFSPKVNVEETDKGLRVKAELPGMEEKDIEVTLTDDGLSISGEKKTEKEEKGKTFVRREMSYGSFRRLIPLPAPVEADKVKASFKNGILEIDLPVPEKAPRSVKKIDVKAG
jgi:HSP20 family protein